MARSVVSGAMVCVVVAVVVAAASTVTEFISSDMHSVFKSLGSSSPMERGCICGAVLHTNKSVGTSGRGGAGVLFREFS